MSKAKKLGTIIALALRIAVWLIKKAFKESEMPD